MLGDGAAEGRALHLAHERACGGAEAERSDREGPALRQLGKPVHDAVQIGRGDEAGHHDMRERLLRHRRRAQLVVIELDHARSSAAHRERSVTTGAGFTEAVLARGSYHAGRGEPNPACASGTRRVRWRSTRVVARNCAQPRARSQQGSGCRRGRPRARPRRRNRRLMRRRRRARARWKSAAWALTLMANVAMAANSAIFMPLLLKPLQTTDKATVGRRKRLCLLALR